MVDTEIVLEKLRHIRTALARIEQKNPTSREELFGNPDIQDVVLRNMQNALQGCLDIASHIVADEGWGTPTKAADFFIALGQHGVLPTDLSQSFSKLIRFRNILVHEYTKLDFEKAWQAIVRGRKEIDLYCQSIVAWMEKP